MIQHKGEKHRIPIYTIRETPECPKGTSGQNSWTPKRKCRAQTAKWEQNTRNKIISGTDFRDEWEHLRPASANEKHWTHYKATNPNERCWKMKCTDNKGTSRTAL